VFEAAVELFTSDTVEPSTAQDQRHLANFTHELLTKIGDAEDKLGPLNNAQVSEIVRETRENFSLRIDSDKTKYKLHQIITLPNGAKVQVVGFKGNGGARVEIDPTKFKPEKIVK